MTLVERLRLVDGRHINGAYDHEAAEVIELCVETLKDVRGAILLQRDLIEGGKNASAWAYPLKVIDAAIAKAEAQ